MAAYPVDSRERIVEAAERQSGSKRKSAALFGVREACLYKLLRRKRERGDIAPLPHGGGASAKLPEEHLRQLPALVAATPDATLAETARAAGKEGAGRGQPQHPLSGPASAGAVAKKKSKRAAQADPQERAAFQEQQQTLAMEDLSFLGAFGIHLPRTRTHARAPLGERVAVTEPLPHGSNLSVISALGVHGVRAPLTIEGAVNSEVFALYVEHLPIPCLRPGHLVLLDNIKFPYAPKALELIEAAGARVVPLPAYSPDFKPLEGGIAKIKTALRSLKARTKRKLTPALAKALARVTKDDLRGWVEHGGSIFSLKGKPL